MGCKYRSQNPNSNAPVDSSDLLRSNAVQSHHILKDTEVKGYGVALGGYEATVDPESYDNRVCVTPIFVHYVQSAITTTSHSESLWTIRLSSFRVRSFLPLFNLITQRQSQQ